MPLVTEVLRNGKPVQFRWSEYVLCAMYTAAIVEHDGEMEFTDGYTIQDIVDEGKVIDFVWSNPIYLLNPDLFKSPLVKRGEQTLLYDHTFGEVEFKAGDVVRAWRE